MKGTKVNRQLPKTPGMVTITAGDTLHFKVCFADAPASAVGDLIRKLRDSLIVEPAAIYQAATDCGCEDVLLLTREGRLTADGKNEEPPKERLDLAREWFHNDNVNPLGPKGVNVAHISMTDEFASAERAKQPWKQFGTPRGRR